MDYITGIQALNIRCTLDTCGDWHSVCMDWSNPTISNSETSVFKEWGLEGPKSVPDNSKKYYVANHIRACLDLMEKGQTRFLYGMRDDFICNDNYSRVIFEKVIQLKDSCYWLDINNLMIHEYRMQWLGFIDEKEEYRTA